MNEIECNRDCLNCPYPVMPKECEDMDLSYEEYQRQKETERNFLDDGPTKRQLINRKSSKKYRERHPERKKLQIKAWEAKNPGYKREWLKRYRLEHPDEARAYREKLAGKAAARREKNKRELEQSQRNIKAFRLSVGLTQKEFGAAVGRKQQAISSWERGINPADWDSLYKAFPEMAQL